jgi:hypothetical protein
MNMMDNRPGAIGEREREFDFLKTIQGNKTTTNNIVVQCKKEIVKEHKTKDIRERENNKKTTLLKITYFGHQRKTLTKIPNNTDIKPMSAVGNTLQQQVTVHKNRQT